MSVEYMSFSAHADAKGIMQLISHCEPKNVLLVHGEGEKMVFLKNKIQQEFGIDCFMPENGETSVIKTKHNIPLDTSLNLLKRQLVPAEEPEEPDPKHLKILHGALLMKGSRMQLTEPSAAFRELGLEEYELRFTCNISLEEEGTISNTTDRVYRRLQREFPHCAVQFSNDGSITIGDSVLVKVSGDEESKNILVSWSHQDEDIGSHIQRVLRPEQC